MYDPLSEKMVDCEARFQRLKKILKKMNRVLVAFSGGVDSTLLLKAAADMLNDRVVAVTAVSETTPNHERSDAEALAKAIGVRHVILQTRELDLPEFASNPENKCYICKKYRFGMLKQLAQEQGIPWIADGSNTDDESDYRPGIRAVRELGIRSPLSEAGLSKSDIRQLSRQLNLSTWNKPAYACLATRIPYHSPITAEKLRQIDACEDLVRILGISGQIRVRHCGDTARIEIDPEELPQIIQPTIRLGIITHFKKFGFRFVALDLEGYVMGSLNRGIGHI